MVAITVILAAVIGAFVLDLGSGVESNVQAGANVAFDSSDDTVRVTFTQTQTDGAVLEATLIEVANNGSTEMSDQTVTLNSVGQSKTWDTSVTGLEDGDRFQVVVTAIDGDQKTVILDKTGTL